MAKVKFGGKPSKQSSIWASAPRHPQALFLEHDFHVPVWWLTHCSARTARTTRISTPVPSAAPSDSFGVTYIIPLSRDCELLSSVLYHNVLTAW